MKISDALAHIQRLYIETAPFIYYVEYHPIYGDKMDDIFDIVNRDAIEVVTSVITLTETLTKPLKTGDKIVVQAYRTLLQQTRYITPVSINMAIAESAADLRSRYNLRTPDALHIATALNNHADAFLTNDLTLQRVKELPILVLDELDATP
ncbi:MAG: type II toxin-antitoxin system VapC family toxin [Chloroflexota bacterium]